MPDKMTVQQAIEFSEQRLKDAKIINDFRPDEMNEKLTYDAQRLFELAKKTLDPRAIFEATKELKATEMMRRAKANDHFAATWRNQQQIDITIWYAHDQLNRAKMYSSLNNGTGQEYIAFAEEKLNAAEKMADAGDLLRDSLIVDDLMNATSMLPRDLTLTQNLENRLAAADATANMSEIMLVGTIAMYLLASQHKNLQHHFLFAPGRMLVNAGSNLVNGVYAAAQGFSSMFYKPAPESPQIKSRLVNEASANTVATRTMSHTA